MITYRSFVKTAKGKIRPIVPMALISSTYFSFPNLREIIRCLVAERSTNCSARTAIGVKNLSEVICLVYVKTHQGIRASGEIFFDVVRDELVH